MLQLMTGGGDILTVRQLCVAALAVGVAAVALLGAGSGLGVLDLGAAVVLGGVDCTVCLLADLAYRLGVAVGRAASVTGDIALGDLADLAGLGRGAGGGGPVVPGGGNGCILRLRSCPSCRKRRGICAASGSLAGGGGNNAVRHGGVVSFNVGAVVFTNALCSAVIAAGCVFCPGIGDFAPLVAEGGKGHILGSGGEAIRGRERRRVGAYAVIQAGGSLRHSVAHSGKLRNILFAALAFFGCRAHIAVRNCCPHIAGLAPVVVEGGDVLAVGQLFFAVLAIDITGIALFGAGSGLRAL